MRNNGYSSMKTLTITTIYFASQSLFKLESCTGHTGACSNHKVQWWPQGNIGSQGEFSSSSYHKSVIACVDSSSQWAVTLEMHFFANSLSLQYRWNIIRLYILSYHSKWNIDVKLTQVMSFYYFIEMLIQQSLSITFGMPGNLDL